MENNMQHKIITIPNLLSFFRLCLIPFFMWTYIIEGDSFATTCILILSGITDIADGYIARHFNMISDLGKVLDPIADKLTQAAMLLCLFTRFPLMIVILSLMVIKELYMGISGFLVIRKTGTVYGSNWHGKIATFFLYVTMILHVIWQDIPTIISNLFIISCIGMMSLSLILYGIRNTKALKITNIGEKE